MNWLRNFLWRFLNLDEELRDLQNDMEADTDSKISGLQHGLGRLENSLNDLESDVETDIDDLKAEIRNLNGFN